MEDHFQEFSKKRATLPDKSLGALAHCCSICRGKFISTSPPFDSMLFMVMNPSLLVSIARGDGGRGFPTPVMSSQILSKIACQRIFMLSDPGVPRTFVVDCSFLKDQAHPLFSQDSNSFSLFPQRCSRRRN